MGRLIDMNQGMGTSMNISRKDKKRPASVAPIGLLLGFLLFGGCDLSVTNPGPVQDSFLDEEGAYPAILQGVLRQHGMGYTRIALDGAMIAREAIPGGLFGTDFMLGTMTSDNVGDHWQNLQGARWIAEDAVRRLSDVGNASGPVYAELLIQAGYINRALGHHMCTALFDGGGAGDFMQYFDRAEQHFTDGLSAAEAAGADDLVYAARAGRADVHIWKQNWTAAVTDAQSVPEDFEYQIFFDELDFQSGANEMYFRQAALPWREYTIWNTFMEGYYEDTGDPRMAWRTNPEDPTTMVDNHPFYVQLKFTEPAAPHTLSSGWEMLLVEAEDILVNDPGSYEDAVDLINEVRTRNESDDTEDPLPPVSAANLTEAWELLKQERRIELWGEGRRFGDLRRWTMQDRPGDQPLEDVSGRSSCFPVGTTEIDTNENEIPVITAENSPRFP